MKQELMGQFGPNYALCRYGLSRQRFRGPRRPLDERFVAFLGGTETFGKFLDRPFPARVEDRIGEICVNFGSVNAGIDAHARDTAITAACHDALATVVQVPGVQNQCNRFYSVHPRRNDRFLRPSAALETLYPDIDFADFAFTRHLLLALEQTCPERFNLVRAELQDHWTARMTGFLTAIHGPLVLFWFADHSPPLQASGQDVMTADPLFVTRSMLETLADQVSDTVVVVSEPEGDRCAGLSFHPVERAAAETMLGEKAHEAAAEALSAALEPILSCPDQI